MRLDMWSYDQQLWRTFYKGKLVDGWGLDVRELLGDGNPFDYLWSTEL